MAKLTKAQFKGQAATTVEDNAQGDVSTGDVRKMFIDAADSFVFIDDAGTELQRPGFSEIQQGTSTTPRAWAASDVRAAALEFQPDEYAPGTDSATTTDIRHFTPANVAELAQDVQDDGLAQGGDIKAAIDSAVSGLQPGSGGGLSEAQVDARVQAGVATHTADEDAHHTPPDVAGLTGRLSELEEFEAALRSNTDIIRGYAETIAVGGAAARIGNVLLPSAEADRELIITINNGTRDTGYTADLAEIRAKPSVNQSDQLSSANAVFIHNAADAEQYFIAHGGGNNQLFFASDTIGNYTVTIVDSRVNATPFVRGLPLARTTGDLPASRVSGLPQPSDGGLASVASDDTLDGSGTSADPLKVASPYSEAAVQNLISSRLTTIDAVFSATFTGAAGVGGDLGNTGIFTTLPTNFTIDGTTYHVEQVFQTSADNDLWIGFSSQLPAGYAVQINGHKVALRYVQEVGGDFRYLADGAPAGTVVVGQNTITIYEPLSEENFLPGGGRAGQIVEAQADGSRDWVDLPVPRSATTSLWDRHSQGIAIANAGVASRSSFFVNADPFVIGQKHGLVFVTAEWRIVGGVNIQLGDDVLDSFDITLSDLRASTAYDNAAVNGIKVGSVELQSTASGNPKIGDVDLYVGKNGSDQIGFWLNHTVSGGVSSQTATSIQAVLSIRVFQHDGTASAPAPPSGGGITLQDTDRLFNPVTAWSEVQYTVPESGLILVIVNDSGQYLTFGMDAALLRALRVTGMEQNAPAHGSYFEARGPNDRILRFGRTAANGLLLTSVASNLPARARVYIYGP